MFTSCLHSKSEICNPQSTIEMCRISFSFRLRQSPFHSPVCEKAHILNYKSSVIQKVTSIAPTRLMKDTVEIVCPYCGELNQIYIDYSGGEVQSYYEDCQICCQSWEIKVDLSGDEPVVTVVRSD